MVDHMMQEDLALSHLSTIKMELYMMMMGIMFQDGVMQFRLFIITSMMTIYPHNKPNVN